MGLKKKLERSCVPLSPLYGVRVQVEREDLQLVSLLEGRLAFGMKISFAILSKRNNRREALDSPVSPCKW